ncbi:chromosome segregation protein SMC [Roseateles sp. BYS180W]|uniref:Chromosome partition protein Smc n=1 Tax=Roseateles rivi TaxID=3299028 RepID=A0ABW7FY04_9BURK
MRLTSIKLSGFKSFAEPTHFQLPGQLVGVVGPNGCGKSNIMDAVRWVLGESKASELRGESMQDVIFNGSGNRKPASRASVELVFDNSSARAGGQWNQFGEIAVKRVLTRDGTSSYYINNQPVRRRDVQDVFLGTGLGPRAYAIIGQGTISRIIESKPEELRMFLEEAAGVSKYKERRRETENRLKDTRENLTRVDDILRELNAQLEKLERQAEVASRYQGLQDQGTLKLHQLWFLKHRDAAGEAARVKTEHLEAVNALEARLAELRHTEAELEVLRQQHFDAGDALHAEQGLYAEAQLAVSRLEERIRYVVEGRSRLQTRLAEVQAQNEQWLQRSRAAQEELDALALQLEQAQEHGEVLEAQAQEQALRLPELEEQLRQAQQRSTEQRAQVTQVQQQIQVLAAESRSLDEQQRSLQLRRERFAQERSALSAPDDAVLAQLRSDCEEADAQLELSQAQLAELTEQAAQADLLRQQAQRDAQLQSATLTDISARVSALRALQERVQTEGKLQPWLAKHGLQQLQPLWRQLHITPGWEAALEAALRERMGALAVGRLETVQAFAQDAPPARLAFYALPQQAEPPKAHALPALLDLLKFDTESAPLSAPSGHLKALLSDWLEGIYTADSLEQALLQRPQLRHGELIMTRQGHAVGAHAVSFYAPDSETAGLLARAQEIEQLDLQQRAQSLISDEARSQAVRAEAAYADITQRQNAQRRQASEAQERAHRLHVELLRQSQLSETARARHRQLEEELGELDAQLQFLQERRAEGEARFEELDMQLANTQERHAELEDAVLDTERRLNDAREQQRGLERRAQEAHFNARSLQARRSEMERTIETARQQIELGQQGVAQMQQEQAELDDAAAQAGLQEALELKTQREQALSQVRQNYDDLSLRLKRGEEQRLTLERALEPLRAAISQLQLDEQAAQLGGQQYLDQLQAAGVDLQVLEAGIAAQDVKLWGLQTEIDRINREIAQLGAVNLAALEELGAARERKQFLDAQYSDLTHAIGTLEDAIRRIDLETRDLLGNTFAQVNDHFGRMFPSLFGGGQAKLVMTGDEILDAGVQVMAQPPGKKNSTIHLLSGGEKALTAIALVFAIFQLNPAPFCLLDEVDAPLDDANTERYAKLVTQMSEVTQFLFISHNKIAMEMAKQLIGVTMQEQGVSRIVAVDMESALAMSES